MIVRAGALIICRLDCFVDLWFSGDSRKNHVLLTDRADFEMHATIHVAADVAAVETERTLFTEADDLDLILRNTGAHEFSFHRLRPLHAELHVVDGGTLSIRMALHENAEVGIVLRQIGLRGEDGLGVVGESPAAHLEIDIGMDAVWLMTGGGDGLAVHDRLDGRGRAGFEHVRDLRAAQGFSSGLRDIGLTLPGVEPDGSDGDGQDEDHPADDIDLLRALLRSDYGRGNVS